MSAVASPQMHPLASEVQTPRYHLPDGGGVEDPSIAGGSIEKLYPKQMSDSPRPPPRHKKLSRQSAMLLNVSETEDGGSQDRLNAIVQSNQTEQRSNKGNDFTTVREQPVSTAGQQRSEKPVAKPRTKHRLLAEDSRRKTEATFEVFNPILPNDQLKSSAGEISVPLDSTPNVDLSDSTNQKDPPCTFRIELNIIAPERQGHNSNRGWRKRGVVFNGTSLRHYMDLCSPVPIRIIPLKCMVKVRCGYKTQTTKTVSDLSCTPTLKIAFSCFPRETADDCIKWALTLGAAITQCQKYGWFQEDAEKPDKKGFVRINSKKYFSTVMSQKLTYYDTLEDFEMGSPRHEIELKLASFKIVDPKKFKLKLSTHKTFFDLTFEDQDDMQQWTSALADAIASSLSDDAVLKRVRANESNSWCADCGSERSYWASVNLGIVLCENCAGVHRTFNLKQSKVRSLRMDITVWTPSLVDLMTHIGNANANAFWEHSLPPGAKIIPSSTTEERRAFLNDKYIAKKFCDRTEDKVSESSDIVAMSGSTDVLGVMKLLFTREDASQEDISAAYEVAKRNGLTLVSEFLFQNGGDRQQLENTYNEKLEEIRLKGYLQKTGPRGRHFEKRWCVLTHGALMYYTNDKESKCKGLIQRNDMLMVRVKDPGGHQFDVSTKFKDARIYTFSSEDKEGAYKWMQVLTKAIVAANAWDQIDMKCVRLAGMGFVKDAVDGEWLECFLVVNHNTLYTVRGNHDVLSVELNKVVGCACSGAGQDKFIFLNTLEKTFQVKAKLARDTEKMFETLDYLVPNPCTKL
ncbi:Arf-GAP with Rho-GAP domain, ANK repeat and PH domain-containing protein 1 [Bulinus truncatus]|nr:Arf-GAP with Rho-GAP domain, ANK repeat and PH domain-containing protein 1 [Bulinus truncatus]